jgi:uncharacterized protein
MKNWLAPFVVGFVFAVGLSISGMTQPQKVLGFLDIFGQWDPGLMFVMIGAIGIHFILFKIIRKRTSPMLSPTWEIPAKNQITPALISGSFIFGIGWGMAGYCPGPAVTSLATFDSTPVLFVLSMIAGMIVFNIADSFFSFKR